MRVCVDTFTYAKALLSLRAATPEYALVSACTHADTQYMYRMANTHRIPDLHRSFSAKEPCN